MLDISNGLFKISDELTIYPGFDLNSLNTQDSIRIKMG